MRKANHFINVGLIIVVSTFILRLVFGWMFQLPYGPGAEADLDTLPERLSVFMGFVRPLPASAESVAIDVMFNWHFWMIAFLFALIMGLMLYSVFAFRRKEGDDTDAPHIHGNTALEIAWTVIPIIVVLGFGGYGWVELNRLITPKPDEMTIQVTAFQWGWSFNYPEEVDAGPSPVRGPVMMLAVDQPVLLEMNATDVLHAFWVPEFRVKQDLVPGRTTYLRFTPTDVGDYVLRCAEICGSGHANMLASVRVVSQAEFDEWVIATATTEPYSTMTAEARGERIYREGFGATGAPSCAGCHSVDGSVINGPTWLGIYEKTGTLDDGSTYIADDEYIRNSILNPNDQIVEGFNANVMYQTYAEAIPAFEAEIEGLEGDFDFDVIADLIAFMQTLEATE
ncbi:MAG: cytochrome c oxidase subunit II [Chloroflexota bacterium]